MSAQGGPRTPNGHVSVDEIDLRIIQALQQDGRSSNAKIARQLKVSQGTVRNRIERLRREDLIRVNAWINALKLNLLTNALIRVRTTIDSYDEVARALAAYEEVRYLAITMGDAYITAEVVVSDNDALMHFIEQKIRAIQGITAIEVSVILRVLKTGYHWRTSWQFLQRSTQMDLRTTEAPRSERVRSSSRGRKR